MVGRMGSRCWGAGGEDLRSLRGGRIHSLWVRSRYAGPRLCCHVLGFWKVRSRASRGGKLRVSVSMQGMICGWGEGEGAYSRRSEQWRLSLLHRSRLLWRLGRKLCQRDIGKGEQSPLSTLGGLLQVCSARGERGPWELLGKSYLRIRGSEFWLRNDRSQARF